MLSLEELSAKVKGVRKAQVAWSADLGAQKGARGQVVASIKEEARSSAAMRAEQETHAKAQVFLMAELSSYRKNAIESIEQMTSTGLSMIYGPGAGLRVDTFDDKRSAGETKAFKAELRATGNFKGQPESFILQGGSGGGVHEVTAVVLRQSALDWLGYRGPVLWDEAFKFMSHDEKVENVARFTREYYEVTGRQIIFATHMVGVFGSVADNVVRLRSLDGVVHADNIPPDEVGTLECYEWEDEDDG